MQYNKSYYVHTCQRIETACEAKHPFRNFIFYAIFHSVDSIFCLITTFPLLPFYLLYDETCSWKIYRRDLHMPIPLIGLPSLVLRKGEWKQYLAALSESQFLLFDKCISSPPCRRKRLSEPERPLPKPLHPLHQTGGGREQGRAMNI